MAGNVAEIIIRAVDQATGNIRTVGTSLGAMGTAGAAAVASVNNGLVQLQDSADQTAVQIGQTRGAFVNMAHEAMGGLKQCAEGVAG